MACRPGDRPGGRSPPPRLASSCARPVAGSAAIGTAARAGAPGRLPAPRGGLDGSSLALPAGSSSSAPGLFSLSPPGAAPGEPSPAFVSGLSPFFAAWAGSSEAPGGLGLVRHSRHVSALTGLRSRWRRQDQDHQREGQDTEEDQIPPAVGEDRGGAVDAHPWSGPTPEPTARLGPRAASRRSDHALQSAPRTRRLGHVSLFSRGLVIGTVAIGEAGPAMVSAEAAGHAARACNRARRRPRSARRPGGPPEGEGPLAHRRGRGSRPARSRAGHRAG